MNRATLAVVAALVFLSGLGGYIGSPYYTANQLRVAARNADKQRLEQLVDFPQVREHFKAQLNGQVEKRAGSSSDNLLAGIGADLVSAIGGRLIDRVVTADSIAAVIRSGRAGRESARDAEDPADGPAPSKEHPHERRLLVSGRYTDLNHFVMTIRDRRDPETMAAVLTLTRNGLFAWRVTQIDIPGLLDMDKANSK
jgi:hypothetical protein